MTKPRKTTQQTKKVTPEMETPGTTTNENTSSSTDAVQAGPDTGTEAAVQNEVVQESSTNLVEQSGTESTENHPVQQDVQDNTSQAEEASQVKDVVEESVVQEKQVVIPELPKIDIQKTPAEEQQELFALIDSEVDRILEGCSLVRKSQFEIIKNYVRQMAPRKPVDVVEGKRHQATLALTLNAILNMPDTDGHFTKSLTALLRVFELGSKSTFSEHYAFRFLESVEMTNDKIDEFTRILNLLLVLGPRDGRKEAIRQVDFNKSLRLGFSDEARQRIMAYFNV